MWDLGKQTQGGNLAFATPVHSFPRQEEQADVAGVAWHRKDAVTADSLACLPHSSSGGACKSIAIRFLP